MVKPANRNVDALINVYIYPERTEGVDPLDITAISVITDTFKTDSIDFSYKGLHAIDIVYGGKPSQYSLDGINWLPFCSRVPVYVDEIVEGAFTICKDKNYKVTINSNTTTVDKLYLYIRDDETTASILI